MNCALGGARAVRPRPWRRRRSLDLAELALRGRVTVDDRDRIAVADRSSLGGPVLDDAATTVASTEDKKPKDVLGKVAKGLGDRLYVRLVEAGIVEVHKMRLLPVRHFPLRDPALRQRMWDDLAAILRGVRPPTPRTWVLLGLAVATTALARVFPPEGFALSRRDLENRAAEATESYWATGAVGRAVRDVQAATMATVTAAVTAATVPSGPSYLARKSCARLANLGLALSDRSCPQSDRRQTHVRCRNRK